MKSTLSDQERDQPEDAFQPTCDRRLRARCQAILTAARGRRHRHLAEDVRLRVRTIPRWLKAYPQRGLNGLKSRWAPGRAARLPEALAPTILTWLTQGPTGYGLERAHWTSAELAT